MYDFRNSKVKKECHVDFGSFPYLSFWIVMDKKMVVRNVKNFF